MPLVAVISKKTRQRDDAKTNEQVMKAHSHKLIFIMPSKWRKARITKTGLLSCPTRKINLVPLIFEDEGILQKDWINYCEGVPS